MKTCCDCGMPIKGDAKRISYDIVDEHDHGEWSKGIDIEADICLVCWHKGQSDLPPWAD